MNKTNFDQANIFGQGEPNTTFAQYFTGQSFLNPLAKVEDAGIAFLNVTFEPVSDEIYSRLASAQSA